MEKKERIAQLEELEFEASIGECAIMSEDILARDWNDDEPELCDCLPADKKGC